jgi:hypothetical protein
MAVPGVVVSINESSDLQTSGSRGSAFHQGFLHFSFRIGSMSANRNTQAPKGILCTKKDYKQEKKTKIKSD